MLSSTTNLLGALAVACLDRQLAAMRADGLEEADLAALLFVRHKPGAMVGQVAEAAGLTHSGAVRVIDRLAAAGHVARAPGRDRRAVALNLTPAGRAVVRRVLRARRRALDRMLSGLDDRDVAALGRIAGRLLGAEPGQVTDAWRICRFCERGVCLPAGCPVAAAVDPLDRKGESHADRT